MPRAVAVLAALVGGVMATALLAAPAGASTASAEWGGSTASAASPATSDLRITLKVDTESGPRLLDDPRHAVMHHLLGDTGDVVVTVAIDPELTSFYGYLGTLEAPDAPNGGYSGACSSTSITVTDVFECSFVVPVRLGLNRIDFVLRAFGGGRTEAHGALYGVRFGAEAALQTQGAGGSWIDFPDGDLVLPGAHTTGLRYSIRNLGGLPFWAEGSCSDLPINPSDELICVLRGPRPVLALIGEYRLPLTIRDSTGSVVPIELYGRLLAGEAAPVVGFSSGGAVSGVDSVAEASAEAAAAELAEESTVARANGIGPDAERMPSDSVILSAAALLALLGAVALWWVRQTGRSSSTTASTSGSSTRSSGSIVGGGEGSSSSSGTSRSSSRFGS